MNLITKYFLLIFAASTLLLNVGCSTTPRAKPATVVDRSGGNSEATPPGYYRVKRGDTLARIALDNGQSPRDLAQWNNMSNPNQIEVGDLILVKPPAGSKSAVKPPVKSAVNTDTAKIDAPKVDASKPDTSKSLAKALSMVPKPQPKSSNFLLPAIGIALNVSNLRLMSSTGGANESLYPEAQSCIVPDS